MMLFAVAAIGSMLELAGRGGPGHEGIRMGLWGASQAAAFGIGGLVGALAVDQLRRVLADTGRAFETVFAIEAGLFIIAALIALKLNDRMGQQAGRPAAQEALA